MEYQLSVSLNVSQSIKMKLTSNACFCHGLGFLDMIQMILSSSCVGQNNILIDLMTDIDHYSLNRKIHASAKNDDDLFNVRYTVADESHIRDLSPEQEKEETKKEHITRLLNRQEPKYIPKIKHRKGSVEAKETHNPSVPHSKHRPIHKKEYRLKQENPSKAEEADRSEDNSSIIEEPPSQEEPSPSKEKKAQESYEMMEKLGDDDSDALQELKEIPLLNKRSKSSQFKELFQQMQLARASQISIKDPRRLYDDYIELSVIEESRSKGEKKYFRGMVQFSDTVKWYCNIISSELQGVLVVQGRSTNRAMHEDEVFFVVVTEVKEKTLCRVVAIAARRVREVVGKIQFNKSKQLYLLRPTNAKFACMNIDLTQIDKQWLPHACSKYFLAEFAYWDPTDDHPYCTIKAEYGTFGQVEIETQALLKTYSIEEPRYSQEDIEKFIAPFKDNLDPQGEYVPSGQELKRRKDFRKWRTFIIRDGEFDTAFSVFPVSVRGKTDPNFLKRNLFEVNVHFTDVGFFIREGTAVDEQVKRRVVGYNLVHRVVSLLPEPFSSTFCSLRQNHDSLTLSICFQIDEEGNIQQTSKITKSIICPPFAFNNEQLQRIISAEVPAEEWRGWDCGCKMESQYKAISTDIRLISKLISKRRQRRIQTGALIFQIPVKCFKFDQNLTPTSFELRSKNQAHYMVEECVITASTKAAEFLLKNLKGKAILYRHRFPGFKRLAKFRHSLKKAGQTLPQNVRQVQKFVNGVVTGGQLKQCLRDVIKYQTVKLLEGFDYFQALGSDPTTWVHYAINIPLYTHCGAPTKYYGDLLVQRQLDAAIEGQPWNTPDAELGQLLENCSKGKLIAQHIQYGCQKIFLCLYLRDNPVFTNAVLTDIQEWGLKICVPKFNFKTMIKFKQLHSVKAGKVGTDENSRRFVRLEFNSETEDFKTKILLREMQEINVQIRSADTYPLDYAFSIVLPHPTDPAQKILIN